MTWLGRQMMSYSNNSTSISYTYDADGLRTSKTVNGVKHNYYYVDGQLRYERNGDNYEIYYTYDADGRPVLATKRDLVAKKNYQYYLITNTRGDVIETRDDYGNVSARFVYDAWGKLVSVTDANGNALSTDSFAYQISLKYRGYVYDNETGLYYLQSRYYDPETGRFLNADDVDYIGYSGEQLSYNAFAYCENEPVVRIDTTGKTYRNLFNGLYKNVVLNILIEYIKGKADFKQGKQLIRRIESATKIYFNSKKSKHEGISRYEITVESGEYARHSDSYIFYLGDWFSWDNLIRSYENNLLYKIVASDSGTVLTSIALLMLAAKFKIVGKILSVIEIPADIPVSKFITVVKGSRSALDTSKELKRTDLTFILLTKIQVYSYVEGLDNTSLFYIAYSGDDSIGVVI